MLHHNGNMDEGEGLCKGDNLAWLGSVQVDDPQQFEEIFSSMPGMMGDQLTEHACVGGHQMNGHHLQQQQIDSMMMGASNLSWLN